MINDNDYKNKNLVRINDYKNKNLLVRMRYVNYIISNAFF